MATDWSAFFAKRTQRMQVSAIRELLKVVARPEVISFAGGIPANETLPVQAVAEACERILATNGVQALQYGPTEGYQPLRELIAESYRRRGVQATAENILITTGSQQGLDLAGKTLINDDDKVIMELPTYVGALQAWRPYGPSFTGVAMDDHGIQTETLATITDAKLLYLIPNFQNPSGISLSQDRRKRAVEIAHQNNFLIVEDDPYRELRYSGQDIPALVEIEGQMLGADWNERGHVIHFGTFSKTLAPGLRIGWTLAPSTLIHMFVLAKQGTDLHSSTLSMLVAEDLMRNGILDAGLPALRDLYRERRDTMIDALQTYVGDLATWTYPDGGLFLWVTLRNSAINTMELLGEALKKDVAFVSGDGFFFNGQGYDSLRLNFSNMPPERIREGIRRLGSLIAEQQSKPAAAGVR